MHVGVYMLINELCILALNGNQENQNGGTRPMHVEVYMSMNVNFHPEAQRFLPSLWDGSAEGSAALPLEYEDLQGPPSRNASG